VLPATAICVELIPAISAACGVANENRDYWGSAFAEAFESFSKVCFLLFGQVLKVHNALPKPHRKDASTKLAQLARPRSITPVFMLVK
jgi:hypothetical protein